jgi:hypothetical protein
MLYKITTALVALASTVSAQDSTVSAQASTVSAQASTVSAQQVPQFVACDAQLSCNAVLGNGTTDAACYLVSPLAAPKTVT